MGKSDSPLLNMYNSLHIKKKTVLCYSVVFALMALVIFGSTFIANGRSLIIATSDGLSQHIPIMSYYGEYLRTILRNIFVEHNFVIPMFDFSIGLGADIVSTLHYYGLGDPLNLLYVFVSAEHAEYLYGFLCVLRMYLTGFTFIFYMLHRNRNVSAVVTGAVAYAFSGFCLVLAVRHPFFLTGLMYCPLIFLGIDLILEKHSPVLYIVSLALITITNFYFAYMTCIIMLFYAAMKYFEKTKKAGFKVFACTVGKFALYTVNAFLIPMIIFLPQIENILSTGRLNADNEVNLFYNPSYYASLLDSVTNPSSNTYYTLLGYTGVALLCVILCFVRFRKHKNTAVGFLIASVGVLFPVFGHIMNGFAYVTNRWSWIFAFIAAVAVVTCYDELFELNAKEKKLLWIICVVYLVIICCIVKARSEISLLMIAVMFATLCLVSVADSIDISKARGQQIVSVMIVGCIIMQALYMYDYREGNGTANALVEGEVYDIMYTNTAASLVNSLDDEDEFFRYDDYYNAITENSAILGDVNSASFYYSIANEYVTQFIQELGLNFPMEQRWLNLDNRYILQSILGCKYTTTKSNNAKALLYKKLDNSLSFNTKLTVNGTSTDYYRGYASHEASETYSFGLTKLNFAMPMGYTYDSVMSRAEYEKLSPVEKQNVLLQTAVTDDVNSLNIANIRTEKVAEYDVFELIKNNGVVSEGITIDGNTITVNSTSATITVNVPMLGYSESYLSVDGLSYTDICTYESVREEVSLALEEQQQRNYDNNVDTQVSLDGIAQRRLDRNEYYYEGAETVNIIAKSEYLGKNSLSYYTPKNKFYSGADTFMVNLGCVPISFLEKNLTDTVELTFSHTGVYKIDNFSICYQSLTGIMDDYSARTENVLENVEITDCENTVKGTIALTETKLLAMQIPYSKGWTATVDGEEAEILNVNTMFCGLLLEPGEHTVEFHYTTPYAVLAVTMTLTGIAGVIAIAFIWKRKEKKRSQIDVSESTK